MLPQQLLAKRFMIILGVCVTLIILVVAGYFIKHDLRVSENTIFGKTSLSIAHVENPKNNFEYFQFVLPDSKRNIVQCEKYKDFELNTRCYQSLALLHKDASYCESIGKSFEVGWMHRDTCYDEVARDTQNVALCENIQNKDALSGDYVSCVASIIKEVSKCPPLGDPYNGSYSCYMEVAIVRKDLSVCDLFGNDKDSKSICYRNVAEQKQDSSIKVRNNNIETCNNFNDQSSKNNCFWKVANEKNNPSFCELIKPDKYDLDTNQCVTQSSPAMPDSSLCDNLKDTHYDTSDRDICYFQYATTNQKPAVCEKMEKTSFKEKCLKEISN